MTTHIFVLLLNCSAIIFFFFWRPLLHLTFLPYLAGKPFFPLSPSPALKFWLLFISLICARKGSRGLVIMDTDFRGVSFHAIKILPLPPPRKCIKKKRGKSEWESRRESSPTERVPFLKPGWAPQWAMKRWIEWLSCLVIRKRGELGFLCGVGVACAGPSLTLLKERGVGWGVWGGAQRVQGHWEKEKTPGTMKVHERDSRSPGALNAARLWLAQGQPQGSQTE